MKLAAYLFKHRLRLPLVLCLVVSALPLACANAATLFNNWTSSGPFPAPSRATIKALAIAPTTPVATVYLGSDGGGVYSMSEGGSSWTAINANLTNKQVQALAIHPFDPKVLYLGTKVGVFKSGDGGISWNPLASGMPSQGVRGIAIDPQNPSVLYAATGTGVYKSINGGTAWLSANTGLTSLNVRALLIDPTASSVLYAATSGGVFKSEDSGSNWVAVNTSLTDSDVLSLAYAATVPTPTIFAGTNGGGVYASTDSAASWSPDNPGSLANLVVNAILIDNPAAPTTVYVGTQNGLFKQQYSGTTWSAWGAASTGIAVAASVHAIANNPASRTTVYAATSLGAYRSSSAANWSALTSGLYQGCAVAAKPSDPTVIVAGFAGGGIYRSSDSGDSWISTIDDAAGRLFTTALLYDSTGSTLYAGSGNGVFKSGNDGANWTDISATLASTDVRALALGPGSLLHAATAAGVLVWNGIDTWTAYSAGQPTNSDVTSLAFQGSTVFAGTNGGGVHRSDGVSWTRQNTGLTSTVINTLASDSTGLYLGTEAGIFRSADSGDSWTAINSGITNLSVKSLAVSSGAPSFLTAGTNGGGVFFSTNGGDVWTAMNTGLTDKKVNALTASAGTRKVYAATGGGKMFNLNLSAVSAITPAAPLPAAPVDFGKINIPDTKTLTFSLQNTGTLQLKISAIALGGTDQALFTVTQGGSRQCTLAALPDLVIEAGDHCTVNVNFLPSAPGNKTAALTLHSDAINQPVVTYLSGTGGFPPQATITSPSDGDTGRNPATIAGSAVDKSQINGAPGNGATLAKVEVSTDGGATWHDATRSPTLNSWTQWSYNWTATPLPLSGPYSVKARATDSNGFIQTALSAIDIAIDNIPPVTDITDHPGALDNSASGSFSFSVDKTGSSSQCQIDAAALAPCTTPYSYGNLSDGAHSFSVISTDAVGNVESAAKSVAWVTDTVLPDASITGVPASFTQSASASFTFSASEASSFVCTMDGVAAPCSSPKSYSALADGGHLFTVQATDQAGNTVGSAPSRRSYGWIVDANNKPASAMNVPLAPLSGVSYLLTGTATDTVSGVNMVNLSINSGSANPAVDSAVAPAAPWSSWSYLWSLPVNGTYSIQVQSVDNAGNVQAGQVSNSIIIANPAPTVELATPASDALVGGSTPRSITGTARAAAGGFPLQKVQVAVFPAATPPATVNWVDVNGATEWSYNWQFPADGSYTIQARSLDVAPNLAGAVSGNVSQVSSRNVTIDTTPPSSTVNTPLNPFISGHQISVSGTADDPATGTGVKQVNIAIVDGSGQSSIGVPSYSSTDKTWNYTSGALPDGSYTVQATVVDNAGNQQAAPATTTVTIDNVPPVTGITAKPASLSNLPTASFSFTADEQSSFSCTLDGTAAPCVCTSATGTACTQSYTGLTSGPHSFSVSAKDRAGNLELSEKTVNWSIDLVPPTVTGVTPADGTIRLGVANAAITATFSKDLDPASVTGATLYLDHGAAGTVSYDPATRKATFTPNAPLAYATTYTATLGTGIADPAGNHLAGSHSWTFSTDPEGDINLDGKVDLADALLCLKAAVALVTPTAEQLRHADLAPFKDGKPWSDGKIDASDALVILSRVVGSVTW